MQYRPAPQALPQAPQCDALEPTAVSQPFAALLSQSAKPPAHEPTPQVPFEQPGAPFATAGQALPHAPQFAMLLAALISQPSVTELLQSMKGAAHT